jgi:hypothetical protein
MSWARVMVPLAGTAGDAAVLSAAVRAAAPFDAEVSAVFAPADVADIMPWLGEGYLGGVQTTAIETLRQAAATVERRRSPRKALDGRAGLWPRRPGGPCLGEPRSGRVWRCRRPGSPTWWSSLMTPRRAAGALWPRPSSRSIADEQRPVLIVARPGFRARRRRPWSPGTAARRPAAPLRTGPAAAAEGVLGRAGLRAGRLIAQLRSGPGD